MKMSEAQKIIKVSRKKEGEGFMVSFHKRGGGVLHGDHFPDKHAGEKLIPNKEKAWQMAAVFAQATNELHVDIYVIDHNFRPVKGYDKKTLKRYM